MAYYGNNHPNTHNNTNHSNAWAAGIPPGNQGHWDPSRPLTHPNATGAKPSPAPAYDSQSPQASSRNNAPGPNDHGEPFYYQFKSIDRALESWRKSTKAGNEARGPMGPRFSAPVEFAPMQAPPFNGPPPPTFFPPPGPSGPSGPSPRFSGARSNEPDQSFQAKRRIAAQRERDLRNYHQDQQFNKHLSGAKSDRSMSPNTAMSESDRRELIARQHKALYGEDSSLYNGGDSSRAGHRPQDEHGNPGNEASSALSTNEVQRQPRSRAASNTSPNTTVGNNSSGNSSHQQTDVSKQSPPQENDSSVAPIGTRQQQQAPEASANGGTAAPRRFSPPLAVPSYGQSQGESKSAANAANSNSNSNDSNKNGAQNGANSRAANANAEGGIQEDKPAGNTRGAWGASGAWGQPKVWR